jgi:hypothetical protein
MRGWFWPPGVIGGPRAVTFAESGDTLNLMIDDGAAWRAGTGGRG